MAKKWSKTNHEAIINVYSYFLILSLPGFESELWMCDVRGGKLVLQCLRNRMNDTDMGQLGINLGKLPS